MAQWVQKRRYEILLLLIFLWVNILVGSKHEMWRDEAQAWLVVRDLDMGGIFRQLQYEGHPWLWYLILLPFAKLGAPYPIILWISMGMMAVAAWIFLMRAPLALWAKAACIFSAAFVYYLPVISRSYALIPPMLMLVADWYDRRHSRPIAYAILLGLLSQIHVLLCGLVGALMLFWTVEHWLLWKKKSVQLKGFLVALGIMLASVAGLGMLIPSTSLNQQVSQNQVGLSGGVVENVKKAVMTLEEWQSTQTRITLYQTDSMYYRLITLAIFLCLLILTVNWFRRAPKAAGIFFISLAWQVILYSYIYFLSPQRSIIIFWQFIFAAWISMENQGEVTALKPRQQLDRRVEGQLRQAMSAVILVFAVLTFSKTYADVRFEVSDQGIYSASQEAAQYIRTSLPEDSIIIMESENYVGAVAAYFDKGKFYNPIRGNYENFVSFDGNGRNWSRYGNLREAVEVLHARDETIPVYLMVPHAYAESAKEMAERSAITLHEEKEWMNSAIPVETYWLYRIEP